MLCVNVETVIHFKMKAYLCGYSYSLLAESQEHSVSVWCCVPSNWIMTNCLFLINYHSETPNIKLSPIQQENQQCHLVYNTHLLPHAQLFLLLLPSAYSKGIQGKIGFAGILLYNFVRFCMELLHAVNLHYKNKTELYWTKIRGYVGLTFL